MGELPNWVYDVVMQLQKWGDEHGNLFMLRYDGAYIPETECCRALGMVPDDVRKHAAVIANYKRGEASDKTQTDILVDLAADTAREARGE